MPNSLTTARWLVLLSCLTLSGAASAADPGDFSPVSGGLLLILTMAILGGLVLNLMPCVLPVLSLKVLSLLDVGTPAQARKHALAYTAGVVLSFVLIGMVIIGLREGGHVLGWGFQLQQPLFVAGLAWLMVLVGLSLAGLFTLGGTVGGAGQKLLAKRGYAGDFWSGVLACVVASPCIAPFMGAPLAYALGTSTAGALAVFAALGIGLALPFLVVGFVPRLARWLPRPGAWMETLKVLLAYPMLLTAAWLVWLLGKQMGIDAVALMLVAMVLLALGLWLFEQGRWRSQCWRRVIGAGIVVLSLLFLPALKYLPTSGAEPAAPSQLTGASSYSPRDLAQLRKEGRQVLVAVTADWCITCIANEQAVLGTARFRSLLADSETVYMKADWTANDPVVGEYLMQHNAPGVPLYVLYRGEHDGVVLPQILSHDGMRQALQRR